MIVYSAPYSPELIPIEHIFDNWKSYMKRWRCDFTANWLEVHVMVVASVTDYQYVKKKTLVELVANRRLSDTCDSV